MSEHDELCQDSEGTPHYRQCVCFPVRMAREAERERIRDAVKRLHTPVNYGKKYGLAHESFDVLQCDQCADMCHSDTGLCRHGCHL